MIAQGVFIKTGEGAVMIAGSIKHEWEPDLHLVPIPLVSNRSH